MCVHNNQNWNCSQCCYPSVPSAWFQTQSSCSVNNCFPVSPSAQPSPTTFPLNGVYLLSATLALDPVKLFTAPLQKYVLVGAPGAGLMIQPLMVRTYMSVLQPPATAIPYNNGFGSPPVVNFNIGSNILYTNSSVLGSTVNTTTFNTLAANVFTSTFDNLPLEVGTDIVPVAGNGTLYIRVLYTISVI